MKNYIVLENEYFQIIIPQSLKKYGSEVLNYSTNKIKDYLDFFNESAYDEKIKGAFFINSNDFFARIKTLDPKATPPSWAQGCFYGGETQILLNENDLDANFFTLAHETFHLLFSKFIYEKNKIDRIVWLDESLAANFDGHTEKNITDGAFKKIIIKLLNNKNLPKMADLDFDKENIKTSNYNGYDLFSIVGRYLLETKSKDDLLKYIKDTNKITKDGDTILTESLEYFKEKYNLK